MSGLWTRPRGRDASPLRDLSPRSPRARSRQLRSPTHPVACPLGFCASSSRTIAIVPAPSAAVHAARGEGRGRSGAGGGGRGQAERGGDGRGMARGEEGVGSGGREVHRGLPRPPGGGAGGCMAPQGVVAPLRSRPGCCRGFWGVSRGVIIVGVWAEKALVRGVCWAGRSSSFPPPFFYSLIFAIWLLCFFVVFFFLSLVLLLFSVFLCPSSFHSLFFRPCFIVFGL